MKLIHVAQSYSVRKLSPGRLLALAAAAPEHTEDPIDHALANSLAVNRPDIELPQASAYEPATPQRKYSLARVDNFRMAGEDRPVTIMRGDLATVMSKAHATREEKTLLERNADVLTKSGRRCLGIATKEADGTFHMEGFVAVGVEDDDEIRQHSGRSEWVRVNVWSGMLRFQHWANMFLIIAMTLTGYYIMDPYYRPTGGDVGYMMGWIRLIHFVAGFLWIALGISRVVLAFTSKDRQMRWRAFWPLNNKQDFKNLLGIIQYYAFIKRHGPLFLAHNPLQQLSYTGIYVLCLAQMVTGMTLYGLANQTNWFWIMMAYPAHWWGIPVIRLIHAVIMYIIWAFVIIHVYLAVRADALERHGGVSSMFNGAVWMRRGARPVDAPEIG